MLLVVAELKVNETHYIIKITQKQPILALFLILAALSHMVHNVLPSSFIVYFMMFMLSPQIKYMDPSSSS